MLRSFHNLLKLPLEKLLNERLLVKRFLKKYFNPCSENHQYIKENRAVSGTVVVSLAEGLLEETVILYPQSNLLFSRSKWFMCRDNSSVIPKQNLHDFPVFLTGKVMISIRPPMNWVFPMAHKFWNCNFRVFSLNCGSYFFYSQMFKRLKFDCHFFVILCACWKWLFHFLGLVLSLLPQ